MTDQQTKFLVVVGKFLPPDATYCAGGLGFSYDSRMRLSLEEAITNGVCITVPIPEDISGARTGVLRQVAKTLKENNHSWLQPGADENDPWKFDCNLFLNQQETWAKDRPGARWLTGFRQVEPEVDVAAQVVRF